MKTVYLLGAGFSKPAGGPLNDELLPKMVKLARKRKPPLHGRGSLQWLLKSLASLFDPLESWDFEQILTVLHSDTLFETLTGRKAKVASELRDHLLWAVILAISESIGENPRRALYDRFVGSLEEKDSILSLNYDLVLESAMARTLGGYDVGLSESELSGIPDEFDVLSGNLVLKLHGSSNYFRCSKCGNWRVFGWKAAEAALAPLREASFWETSVCRWCNGLLVPVLVPPALEKSVELGQVKTLWASAVGELNSANRLVFIGCSLRPSDFDLQALLLATVGRRRRVNIEVVTKSHSLGPRFTALFPGHNISFHPGGFERWMRSGGQSSH